MNISLEFQRECGKGLRSQVLPSDDGADNGAVGVEGVAQAF